MRYRDIKRVQPRENEWVNEIWLCDKGRYGYHFVDSRHRLTRPLVRRSGSLVETTWQEALEEIAQRLYGVVAGFGGDAIGGLAGGSLANEDLFLFQKLFRELLEFAQSGSPHRARADEAEHDDLAYAFGLGSGTNLGELGKGTTVLVVGADPEEEAPVYLLRLRGIKRRGGELIVANGRPTKLDASATATVRYSLRRRGALRARAAVGDHQERTARAAISSTAAPRISTRCAPRSQPYAAERVAEQTGVARRRSSRRWRNPSPARPTW